MSPKSENLSSSHFSNNRTLRGRSAMNFCGISGLLFIKMWAPHKLGLGNGGLAGSPVEPWLGVGDNIALFRCSGLF